MKLKRGKLTFLVCILLLASLITLVSAQYYGNSGFGFIDLGYGMQQIIDQIVRFLEPIFSVIIGDYSSSEFFFAKSMFLILLIIIIYFILLHVPLFQGYYSISILIAVIVSILCIRFISENEFFLGIFLPYTTLGVVLTTALPFFIFAYGIHAIDLPGIGRKIAWGFFGIVFGVLWSYKYSELSVISNQIYLWSLAGILIMLVMDKRIHAYFRGLNIKTFEKQANDERIAELKAQYLRFRDLDDPESRRVKNRIERKLRWYGSRTPD